MFLTPDGSAFLRRHLFPEDGALRPAGLCRPAAANRRRLPRPARGDRRAERRTARRLRAYAAAARDAGGCRGIALDVALRELQADLRRRRTAASATAPKFPHPAELDFCLRRARSTATTLRAGAGRADADANGRRRHLRSAGRRLLPLQRRWQWTIPHFEKMLYDNGPLLRLYAMRGCGTAAALRQSRARRLRRG